MNTPGDTPSHAEILQLWRECWPERMPQGAGLAQRLRNPDELIWQRSPFGELLALAACRPPETHPYGYLRLLLVHPGWQRRGIGTALAQEVRSRLGPVPLALGEERGHFFPGVTATSLPFWEKAGFSPTGAKCVDMRRDLRDLPPMELPSPFRLTDAREDGILPEILALSAEVFSPRWTADVQATAHAPQQILALIQGQKVVGFALTGTENDPVILPSFLYPAALKRGASGVVGGLGPVGIHPAARGQGLGRDFMLAAMQHLKGRGVQIMGIDWTGIAPFYEKLGFKTWSTYWHMRA